MLWVSLVGLVATLWIAYRTRRFVHSMNGTLATIYDEPIHDSDRCWSCNVSPAETTNDLGLCSGCRVRLISR